MMKKCISRYLFIFLTFNFVHLFPTSKNEEINDDPIVIDVSWNIHDYNLHTIPSVLVPANPLSSRQFSPIDDQIYSNLKKLNVEFARYGAWYPFPHMSVAELDPPSGLFQCGNVGTNYSIHLSCEQNNGRINKIDFASFGTSTGGCGEMKQGNCHAENSSKIVQNLCLGKQKCSVPATRELFGDPCKFIIIRFDNNNKYSYDRFWNSKTIINSN